MNEQNYINEAWGKWREMAITGITRYSDAEVRDLHATFSAFFSDAEKDLGVVESEDNRLKFIRDTKYDQLLATKYRDGAMNARTVEVRADNEYLKTAENRAYAEDNFLIAKANVKALAVVVTALSREISARIKG